MARLGGPLFTAGRLLLWVGGLSGAERSLLCNPCWGEAADEVAVRGKGGGRRPGKGTTSKYSSSLSELRSSSCGVEEVSAAPRAP
ncbi:hypothetical protein E2C01_042017 [Portunus trituberculatus]|uniref:Secreted protein n=1 Tax=Portunus trituberculatus TaxID=210409 RepID=A0A5B7FSJ6_PORTR|nr:hypothetical protein [Portunus trituberculatus]